MRLEAGVALIGCGTVGQSVALRLLGRREALEAASGVRFELRGIAVRSVQRPRAPELPQNLFTADALALACDPSVDLLIECAGGTGAAGEAVECALERGAHVVSANKELIATQGPRLQAIAAACGGSLSYEAAAAGAVPVVRTIAHALAGDEILSIAGVVNGTTNAILCAMENGTDYAHALADAQRLGYAEADPSSDVDGVDAAHKLALLVQLAFGCGVVSGNVPRTGITQIALRDVARARALGYRIRLIAAARKTANGIAAGVAPVLVPELHPFALTAGPQNVVRIVARDAGTLLLHGEGAGAATASAVLGDVVGALRAIAERRIPIRRAFARAPLRVTPFFEGALSVWSDGAQNAA